jgi:hypothetical protein
MAPPAQSAGAKAATRIKGNSNRSERSYWISSKNPLTEPSGLSTVISLPERIVVKQRSCPARMVFQVVQ